MIDDGKVRVNNNNVNIMTTNDECCAIDDMSACHRELCGSILIYE